VTSAFLDFVRSGEASLSIFKIDFDSMEWQNVRQGVRHKVYCEGSRQIRLVEFATSEGDPRWCDLGHIGFVLAGGLEIDFNGQVLSFSAGDGLFIPSGAANSHRGLAIRPGTRLVMVEDSE
jgi:hypothetical protein